MTNKPDTERRFRGRLEELLPFNDMVRAMFEADENDFKDASPDYGKAGYLKTWDKQRQALAEAVPTATHRASDKQVTNTMQALAKSLRVPLDRLNIRLNRAAKSADAPLGSAVADFGLSAVRREISTRDAEGLDGALGRLLSQLRAPGNQAGLTAQGQQAADTNAFAQARQQLAALNVTQNTNQDAGVALTDANVAAGNALWDTLTDVLETGNLLYKQSDPKKARTFTEASLRKRLRRGEGGRGPDQGDAGGQ